jgi:putative NIF3 family GTP cyclohydrolase 1 type 2
VGIGSVGELKEEMSLKDLANLVIEKFDISSVKLFGNEDSKIKRVGILGGSGKSEIDLAVSKDCDVYITGDIDHHSGIDAIEKGISIIDAGHYGLEHVFTKFMYDYFRENLPLIEVQMEKHKEPFTVVCR